MFKCVDGNLASVSVPGHVFNTRVGISKTNPYLIALEEAGTIDAAVPPYHQMNLQYFRHFP